MGENSKIPWTHHTFNPWWGCAHDHTGCLNCYAEALAKRMGQGWGPSAPRRLTGEKNWAKIFRWNIQAQQAGERRRVFCASMADVFDDWAGQVVNWFGDPLFTLTGMEAFTEPHYPGARPLRLDDVRRRLFMTIYQTPWLDWLLLTKRAENVARMVPCRHDTDGDGDCQHCSRGRSHVCKYLPNVWIGTSVSDQPTADEAIDHLIESRGLSPVLFVSAEPMIDNIDLLKSLERPLNKAIQRQQICPPPRPACIEQIRASARYMLDWVIGGLESGNGRRDAGVQALINLQQQCTSVGIPFYTKQDCHQLPDQQGRIPDEVFAMRMFPRVEVHA